MAPDSRPHLASLLQDFLRYGDETAVVYREGLRSTRISYADLALMAGRFAAELERRRIVKGDRVLIWGENGGHWIAAFFGCLVRGVLAVPLDATSSAAFIGRVATEVAPKLCAGSAAHISMLPAGLPILEFEEFASQIPVEPDYSVVDGLNESDPFQIVFTSGTTGDPKGVVHTHRNVLASLGPIEREIGKYRKYERVFHPLRFLHTLPLSHVFGQFMGIWIPSLLAAEVHFESRMAPGGLIEEIAEARMSVAAVVPRVLDILRSHLRTRMPELDARIAASEGSQVWTRWWKFRDVHRLFGLKFWAFVCGGATLPPDLEHFWNALGFAVVQGYGMTETAALVSLNHPFHQARGSIGKVLPGREVQLRDDGEILVRGETVSTAVWEGGQLRTRDAEWLETGDLGSLDEAGNLRYRGRKKDVIVTASGLNIYPEDLEAALQRQPEVKYCTVIEVAGRSGPEPLAVVILRTAGDPADVVRTANLELADYQKIRRWHVWPEPDFPRTSTGKILRREVARVMSPAGVGSIATAGTLGGILQNITGEDVSARADSEDLHIDSLGRVELQSSLESSFGVQIDEGEWQRVRTIGDVRALLQPATLARDTKDEGHVYHLWPWSWASQMIRTVFIESIMRLLVWLLAAPRVESALREDSAMLIVCNHVTAYDVPLILYALPRRMRTRVAVAMGGEVLRDMHRGRNLGHWFVNFVAPAGYWLVTALFNAFPLPQKTGFRESFAHAGRAMDAGFHVLVFPEGRRSPDGEIHAFQTGSGLLWKYLHVSALPVYLGGLGELKREGGWFRSGRIVVRVGAPIMIEPGVDAVTATRILQEAVEKLRDVLQ
jgi:long-chain acyl-CoA synthetase